MGCRGYDEFGNSVASIELPLCRRLIDCVVASAMQMERDGDEELYPAS